MNDIFTSFATEYYNAGFYLKADIASYVQMGLLTADEYFKITGDNYVEPNIS